MNHTLRFWVENVVRCSINVSLTQPGVSASHCSGFDPLGTGETLWNDLKVDGELDPRDIPLTKTRKSCKHSSSLLPSSPCSPKGAGKCKGPEGGRKQKRKGKETGYPLNKGHSYTLFMYSKCIMTDNNIILVVRIHATDRSGTCIHSN